MDRHQSDAPSDAPTAMLSADPTARSWPRLSRRAALVAWASSPTPQACSLSLQPPCPQPQPVCCHQRCSNFPRGTIHRAKIQAPELRVQQHCCDCFPAETRAARNSSSQHHAGQFLFGSIKIGWGRCRYEVALCIPRRRSRTGNPRMWAQERSSSATESADKLGQALGRCQHRKGQDTAQEL